MYNSSMKYKWDNKNVRDYARETGLNEGLEQGLQEGREQGHEQGREQGLQQGREIGLQEGEYKKALEVAREMKTEKFPIDKIAKITKLSVEEIEAL